MDNRYQDRAVGYVDVDVRTQVSEARLEQAELATGCEVKIHLNEAFREGPGAGVTVTLTIAEMRAAPLREVERAAVLAAHELLTRFAAETPERLCELMEETFNRDLQPFVVELPDLGNT